MRASRFPRPLPEQTPGYACALFGLRLVSENSPSPAQPIRREERACVPPPDDSGVSLLELGPGPAPPALRVSRLRVVEGSLALLSPLLPPRPPRFAGCSGISLRLRLGLLFRFADGRRNGFCTFWILTLLSLRLHFTFLSSLLLLIVGMVVFY